MSKAVDEVTKEAMDLPPRERLALASFLLESADAASDPESETAWESEIRDRIRAIDDGSAAGIAYADVMKEAERRFGAVTIRFSEEAQTDFLEAI